MGRNKIRNVIAKIKVAIILQNVDGDVKGCMVGGVIGNVGLAKNKSDVATKIVRMDQLDIVKGTLVG